MKSAATRRFWTLFAALPPEVQKLATKNYRRWRQNPNHPSLQFRRLKGSENRYTIRIGAHYRALGTQSADAMRWVWIGTHADYDQLIQSL